MEQVQTKLVGQTGRLQTHIDVKRLLTKQHFEIERERIFRRSWLPICHTDDVQKRGSYFVFELPTFNASLLVVRGQDDKVRVFHNACRHRGIARGNLGKDDVKLVEMPFNQFVPAFEKKAVDAAMVYAPLIELLTAKLQTARPLPEADLSKTSMGDSLNIMLYSPAFAKTDAAKRFMVAHVKAQREYERAVEAKGDMTPICRVINKYASSMPPDCGGYIFNSVDPNGGVSIESLERYQREWLAWGIMKEAADIRSHVNLEFSKHAVAVLGPFR